jgi:hypothetical protein
MPLEAAQGLLQIPLLHGHSRMDQAVQLTFHFEAKLFASF